MLYKCRFGLSCLGREDKSNFQDIFNMSLYSGGQTGMLHNWCEEKCAADMSRQNYLKLLPC